MATQPPRGIRNNNPLNIRHGQPWQGLCATQTDPAFCQFITMHYGCRAAIRIAKTYITRHHVDTLAAFIARWAPATENDVTAYVSAVCKYTNLQPGTKLHVASKNVILRLLWGMARVECGQVISFQYFENAWPTA